MKRLTEYIYEKEEKTEDNSFDRSKIIFTIWESPDNKVTELKSNTEYQKIEYKLEDNDLGMFIDFLLGFDEGSWQLWIGKIGSCSYDDDPYKSLNTTNFKKVIVDSLDIIEEFIEKVKKDKYNYIQFYKTI